MRKTTLCFLIDENHICLAMKKRGFGVNKWNGVGGKVEYGESIPEAAAREIYEEIGVKTKIRDLEQVGNIKFYFSNKPEWDQQVYIYFTKRWQGAPVESEEMAPKWYDKTKLPYDEMWVDDIHWLPKVLDDKKVRGEFYFNEDGSEIIKFNIREEEQVPLVLPRK